MSTLLGRSTFLGETSNLFTDEKTANARSKIVGWINELPTTNPQTKCEYITKIQETIIGSCIELLDEFLEHILSLAHDTNMDVRKQIVGFIEQICKLRIDLLPQLINIISMLLRDRSPQVIKRVIQACSSIYKNGLQWICNKDTEITDSTEQAWNVLCLVKAQILDLIDNENDGIRTNALKFLEGIVILQSYSDDDSQKRDNDFSLNNIPDNLEIVNKKKLEEEALNIFDILLKFHAATHISSVNLITCTGSLCTIAKMRTNFMEAVVEAYDSLLNNLPPTLTDSQVSSVRKSLKMQFITLLKNRGSYEYQATIKNNLILLGVSQNEIQRNIPRFEKQEIIRRQKRRLEQATNRQSKRSRKDTEKLEKFVLDEVELAKQKYKSNKVNEKFIAERLRYTDVAVNLVINFLPDLPNEMPIEFGRDYTPIRDMSLQPQIAKISKLLGESMTDLKIGPGSAAFTKEPPMRRVCIEEEETPVQTHIESQPLDEDISDNVETEEELERKEEATKKLRENMERMKGEQELIERMKMRAKSLKLQEITKPFSRAMKEQFLLNAVDRILNFERQCMSGCVAAKRRHILTVIAATFPDNVRYFVYDFIMGDIKQRFDLAFSWLFEEYCLLQGFTRHSYVKSEMRPDHAYNELLSKLIESVCERCEFKDKIVLLRRIYLEAPLLTENVLTPLIKLSFEEEFMPHCLELMKDMIILRSTRKNKFIDIMLNFTVHERTDMREKSLEHIITLYQVNKVLLNSIKSFALTWLEYLNNEIPPAKIFADVYGRPEIETAWKEQTVKTCLTLFFTLLPIEPDVYLHKLCEIFPSSTSEIKRTIIHSMDKTIKKVGANNSTLLQTIKECPVGTEVLVMRFIHILNEGVSKPNAELIQRVRDVHANRIKDIRVLIPVLYGLTRQEILNLLPQLIKLSPQVVREVFNRLLNLGVDFKNQKIAATPTDILVELNTINWPDLKPVIKATSLCFEEKEIYTQEVLIAVLQRLVEITPTPTLIMRTAMQSLALYPRLSNFLINILQRLILKQVWRQKLLWDGFLKCCQRLKPQSLSVLLQLPAAQLQKALHRCPDMRAPLLEYAENMQHEPMSGVTPMIMDIITGKSVDVFIADDTGGFISADNIKKEIEEPEENTISSVAVVGNVSIPTVIGAPIQTVQLKHGTITQMTNDAAMQPLPPGEE